MEYANNEPRIIRDFKELEIIIKVMRDSNKKIALTSGTFDILHVGHCRYLKEARYFLKDPENTILIVGVDSDKKVKKQKGPDRPIVPEDERMEMLSHIRYVDVVFLKQPEEEKWKLIKAVKPDVLIISSRTGYNQSEQKELETYCGQIAELESQAETSTTAKIRLIAIDSAQEMKKVFESFYSSMSEILFKFRHELENKMDGMKK